MKRSSLIALAILLLAAIGMSVAQSQGLMMFGVGPGGNPAVSGGGCGTGVIDLSAGCPQPMIGS
jgi:hypothetical protein